MRSSLVAVAVVLLTSPAFAQSGGVTVDGTALLYDLPN